MKKVFLSTSNVHPIPAVLGGATETLIDILIRENETEKKYFFVVLCRYHEQAKLESSVLRFTKIVYFSPISQTPISKCLFDLEIYIYFGIKILKMFGFIKKTIPPRYYYFAYRLCKKLKPDFFVAEGGLYEHYEMICDIIPQNRRYAHLHRVLRGNNKLWSIFPNAIACSNFVGNAYLGPMNPDNVSISVVRNCCDESIFRKTYSSTVVERLRKKLNFKESDFVVIFSGRIVREKGVKELIDAISKIQNKNIKLLIIGSSFYSSSKKTEYWSEVTSKASVLDDRVTMTGFIPNSHLGLYFAISSLCVVPSVWEEPVALVPLEAMNAGVPVLVTDSGGMIEYQKDNCIAVVNREPSLSDNLSVAIERLYGDQDLRYQMSIKGSERAKEFSCKKYYYDFCSLFD